MKRLAALLAALITILMLCTASGETVTPAPTPAPTYTPEEWLALWYQIGNMLRENGKYPYVELQRGDTGYEVRFLQMRLQELGYYNKEVVDVFGPGTYAAMLHFERTNRLHIDGIASAEDQRLLFSSQALYSTGWADWPDNDASDTPTPTPAPPFGDNFHNWGLATIDPGILDNILVTPTLIPDFNLPFITPIPVNPFGP